MKIRAIKRKYYSKRRPYWKKIWKVTSGNVRSNTPEEVEQLLNMNRHYIVNGILLYSSEFVIQESNLDSVVYPPKEAENEELDEPDLETSPKDMESEMPTRTESIKLIAFTTGKHILPSAQFETFLKQLESFLQLNRNATWRVLTSYIMYDFCDSLQTLHQTISDLNFEPLFSNIWNFHTSERMFQLKIMRTCLEFMNMADHPYCLTYKRFICKLGTKNLWRMLVKQFKYLLLELKRSALRGNTPVKLWVQRNATEQIEILQCLMLLAQFANYNLFEFRRIIKIFLSHKFGSRPDYSERLIHLEESVIDKIKYAEYGVILCMADNFWCGKGKWFIGKLSDTIDSEMQSLLDSTEHPLIVFAWIIMNIALPYGPELYMCKYTMWIEQILATNIFSNLNNLVRHEMFNHGSVAGFYIRQALFDLLLILHTTFQREDLLLTYSGVVPILAEALKVPEITEQFFDDEMDSGLIELWLHDLNLFPFKFYTIATLAEAIISASSVYLDSFMKQVERMPFYIVAPNLNEHPAYRKLPLYTRELAVLDKLQSTWESAGVADMNVTIDWTLLTYNNDVLVKYMTYSDMFWEISHMLITALDPAFDLSTNIDNIVAGLKLVITVLQQDSEACCKYHYFHRILTACAIMFVKCREEPNQPFYFLSLCLDVITELLPGYRFVVTSQLLNHKLIPTIPHENYTYVDMISKSMLNYGIFGEMILTSQQSTEHHHFVHSYLRFLNTAIQTNTGDMKLIEMPGLLFVLVKMFPNFMSWYSNQDIGIEDILYQSVNIFYKIFQLKPEELSNDVTRFKMHMVTLFFLLDEPCSKVLLQLLVQGSNTIPSNMEKETNWYNGAVVKHTDTIQVIVSLVYQLLKLRNKIKIAEGPFPLVTSIYKIHYNLKVVKAVVNLLHHSYSSDMSILCFELLGIFIQAMDKSMVASLELEPNQLHMICIQCLRDNYERTDYKEAILDFVNTSISTRTGLTEVFFTTIDTEERLRGVTQQGRNGNVGNFLLEYLMTVPQNAAYLSSPLLYKVVEIFHSLWKTKKEMLIKDLVENENFWPSLCFLLFQRITFDNNVYIQIFQIITREILRKTGNVNQYLKTVLLNFLSTEEIYIVKWVKHIFHHDNTNSESENQQLFKAWEEFLITTVTFMRPTYFNSDCKTLIVSNCCTKLNDLISLQSNEAITCCVELYYFLTKRWGQSCFSENCDILFNDIISVLSKTAESCGWLKKKLKEDILSIVKISLRNLKDILHENYIPCRTLVDALGTLFTNEYQLLKIYEFKEDNCIFQRENHNAYFTVLDIIDIFLTVKKSPLKNEYMKILNESNIFKDIMHCASFCTRLDDSYEFSKCAIRTVGLYACTEESNNLIDYDIAVYCFDEFLPPKKYFKQPNLGIPELLPTDLVSYWEMYEGLIAILYNSLKKYQYFVIKEVMMFVTLHEDYIKDILMLETSYIDFHALQLTQLTLTFLYELIKCNKYWKSDYEECFTSLLDAIKVTFASSAALILRPSIVKYFFINAREKNTEMTENTPEDKLRTLINVIIKIIYSASTCLLLISQPLINSAEDRNDYSNWNVLPKIDFQFPKLGHFELTFGTLIYLSGFLVKILQQMSYRKKRGTSNVPAELKHSKQSDIEIGFIRMDIHTNPLCDLNNVYDFSLRTVPTLYKWYAKLDEISTKRTLESVLLLLALQFGPLFKSTNYLKTRKIGFSRKELRYELYQFQNFVRLKLLRLYPFKKRKSIILDTPVHNIRKYSSQRLASTRHAGPSSASTSRAGPSLASTSFAVLSSDSSSSAGPSSPFTRRASPSAASTSFAGPSLNSTSRAGPSSASTSFAGPSLDSTSRAGPSAASTSFAGPSLDSTSRAGPSAASTSFAGPSLNTTSRAGPSAASTSFAGPSLNSTSPAGPSSASTSFAGPSLDSTSRAGPSAASTSFAGPSSDSTSRAGPSSPFTRRAGPSLASTSFAARPSDSTSRARPSSPFTSRARPSSPFTSRAGPSSASTSFAGPLSDSTSRAGPSSPFTSRAGPSSASTSFAGLSLTSTSHEGPASVSTSHAGPASASTSRAGPPSPFTSRAGPSSASTSFAGPSSSSTSRAGPTSLFTSRAGPSSASTSFAGPSSSSTNRVGRTSPFTCRAGPAAASTSFAGSVSPSTSRAGPTSLFTSRAGPSLASTSFAGPSSSSTNRAGPTSPFTCRAGPSAASASFAGPSSDSTSRAGPSSPFTSRAGPSSVSISFAGPSLDPTSRVGPSSPFTSRAGPSSASTSRADPSPASTSFAGPSWVSTSRAGPSSSSTNHAGPSSASTSRADPSPASTSFAGPSWVSTSRAGPSSASTNHAGPSAFTSHAGPAPASTSFAGSSWVSTSHTGPSSASTNHAGPSSAFTSHAGPPSASISFAGPSSASTSCAGPSSPYISRPGPSSASTSFAGPSSNSTSRPGPPSPFISYTGPSSASTSFSGPSSAYTSRAGPPSPFVSHAGPSSASISFAGPSFASTSRAGPLSPFISCAGPSSASTSFAGPSWVSTSRAGPSSASTSHACPSSASAVRTPINNNSLTTLPDDFIHMLSAWYLYGLRKSRQQQM